MNNIPLVFWLIPIASVVALGMAWFFFRAMMKEDEGTDRMKEIAEHVRKGAMAYLKQQYKVVTIVFVVLALIFAFMAYVLKAQNPWVPFRRSQPVRRSFLRTGWLLRHEDRHLCVGTHSQRRTHKSGQRSEDCFPKRSRNGTRRGGSRTARHCHLVCCS